MIRSCNIIGIVLKVNFVDPMATTVHAHGALWLRHAPDLASLSFLVKLGFLAKQKLSVINGAIKI